MLPQKNWHTKNEKPTCQFLSGGGSVKPSGQFYGTRELACLCQKEWIRNTDNRDERSRSTWR
jgi:hypothetical protein